MSAEPLKQKAEIMTIAESIQTNGQICPSYYEEHMRAQMSACVCVYVCDLERHWRCDSENYI